MSYTMYTPLNVWLDPASVTDVVAYIQTYLSENTIYSETEIETIIHDYLIAHPELIGGVQSVNGKTGTVVLSASDINTENNVTIESVLASLSSQISSIAANVATNTNNITSLTGRVSTAETDLSALKSSFINPQMFGAIGDGVNDDTEAFENALDFVREKIKTKTIVDGFPSEQVGGQCIIIPAGTYKITSPLDIPSNIEFVGSDPNSTILVFSSVDYGLSLDGEPYNSVKTWRGTIKNLRIVMDGSGIGISNIENCDGTSANQNIVCNSEFENITVSNCSLGIGIIGGWVNTLKNIIIHACDYGLILSPLDGVNSCNENVLEQISVTSALACGIWVDCQNAQLSSIVCENIGNGVQGAYNGETIEIISNTYSVTNPCGLYLTGKFNCNIDSYWAEKIENVNGLECYGVLINPNSTTTEPNGRVTLNNPHFNSDVFNPIKILSATLFTVRNPFWITGVNSNYFAYITETTYGRYLFDELPLYLLKMVYVVSGSSVRTVIFKNVRSTGSGGFYDNYLLNGDQSVNVITRDFFEHPTNNSYNVTAEDFVRTSTKDIISNINGVGLERRHYETNKQYVGWQKNTAVVTTVANTNTITVPFGNPYHDATNPKGVVLTARDSDGAQLLAGGYYWSGQNLSANTITITFLNTPASAITLDAFIFAG